MQPFHHFTVLFLHCRFIAPALGLDLLGYEVDDSFDTNQTQSWRAEPETRGTFTILSSCLITLVLCLWSAVHTNLPRPGSWPWVHKLWWLIWGIFIPEYVVNAAIQQNTAAGMIRDDMMRRTGLKKRAVKWPRWAGKEQNKLNMPDANDVEVSAIFLCISIFNFICF
jgi:hypothetical protein